ncbi:del-3 [Pristionchus pacificus]|uniref:Del-3 n=1 Tax=Pristionchus pacificus TaxID=54126 RepID=A0A2A6CCA6_PRIPA|nr:del-3 [Pristionchus pacificus]|eukprot:PDM75756.1 del-3 [Pristionchus pacificus]
MVTCRGCCSAIVIVILLVACGVLFVLHSLYYVQPFLDSVGTKESIKRVASTSQRVPAIVICNRMPFSADGINGVSSGLNNDNTKRYLREWTNSATRDFPEYTAATAAQNTEAYNNINSNLPQLNRKQRMQQMVYQCQSVVNSCSFNGNSMAAYQCCQAVSLFVPTMNGLCWTYFDSTLLATSNTTLPQFIITFTISRNSWYSTDTPTHPGIDIYLRESADDVIRLASDLDTPPMVTIRDKQGVRLRVKKQNRIDSRRFECGMSADAAMNADNNARINNRANMLMCVLSAAMTACNCHPLLAEMMNYNTNTTNTIATTFSNRVNSTTVCTLDQYDQCARRYVETARSQNKDDPLPSDLTALNELQSCRSNNAFPCLRVVYAADPEPFPLPASYTSSQDYVSRLTVDFASLATFDVLQERSIPLFELLSNIGYNIALWFTVGYILWLIFAQMREGCCKQARVSPMQPQPVNGSRHLAPPEAAKLAPVVPAAAPPLPEPAPPSAQSLVAEPKFTPPPPPSSSPPVSAAVSRSVHFTPPPPPAAAAAAAVPPPPTPPSLHDPDPEISAPVPAPRRHSISLDMGDDNIHNQHQNIHN